MQLFTNDNFFWDFTGIFTTCALKRFTLRQVGLLGAFVYSIGSCVAIFVTNIPLFIFANGFLQGKLVTKFSVML